MSKRLQDLELKLSSFFPYMVRMFYQGVSQSVRNVYTPMFGLKANEWRTMVVLNDFEPLSAKEIVSRSSMDKVNVSRAISSLQKSKLLERHVDPTDRRHALLRLNSRAKKMMRELVPMVKEVEKQLLNGLSLEEQETLKALMQKVSLNAQNITPPAIPDQVSKKASSQ